ncbi:MAG: molybdenum cofactor guanylyltransferase [Myxococcota bacterium]
MNAAGIVLCGGLSSRMGRDKAWLPWRGQPLLGHVVDRLVSMLGEVLVVAAPDQLIPTVSARIVRDRAPHLGPLAGIREGLDQMESPAAFITGTDAPFLTPRFVQALVEAGPAAAPEIDGFVQTLAAVYPAEAAAVVEELLATGKRRPLELLERLDFVRIPAQALPDPDCVRGFNTPDQYLAAARKDQPGAMARVEFSGEVPREVPIGTLAEVLEAAAPGHRAHLDGLLRDELRVRVGDGMDVTDPGIPIGPGERVSVGEEMTPAPALPGGESEG